LRTTYQTRISDLSTTFEDEKNMKKIVNQQNYITSHIPRVFKKIIFRPYLFQIIEGKIVWRDGYIG
jgi:hypothetical protein